MVGSRKSCRCSEGVRGRLPFTEALRYELGALLLAPAVQHLEVLGIGSKVDAGGSGIQPKVAIRPCRPVPGGAVGGLYLDLAGLSRERVRAARAPFRPTRIEVSVGTTAFDCGGVDACRRGRDVSSPSRQGAGKSRTPSRTTMASSDRRIRIRISSHDSR